MTDVMDIVHKFLGKKTVTNTTKRGEAEWCAVGVVVKTPGFWCCFDLWKRGEAKMGIFVWVAQMSFSAGVLLMQLQKVSV